MSNEISDLNVFILGAGFSAPAGAPLINDFLDESRQLFDDPDSQLDAVEKSLFEQVFRFKTEVARAREKFRIDLDNIEQLFGLVEMSHRLDRASVGVRDAMVYVIAKTLQLAVEKRKRRPTARIGISNAYQNGRLPWLDFVEPEGGGTSAFHTDIYRHFALLLSGKYDDPNRSQSRSNAVISFNYDLVLDDALRGIGVQPNYELPYALNEDDRIATGPNEGIHLLKLHGSTNWAICRECNKVHVLGTKFTNDPAAFREKPCAKCNRPGLALLLVPPSWDKSEYRDVMRPVWKKAVDALKNATRICVIGYSMPETDTFFKFLLTLGLAENHRLYKFVLVDLETGPTRPVFSDAESELDHTIRNRYQNMLETLFVKRRFEFFGNGFANFLHQGAATAVGRAETIMTMGVY